MNTSTSSPASFRRILAAATAALALAAGSLLLVAGPASAHDELLSTDPAADSSLEALPAQLTLTFSGQLLAEPGATEVQATDAAGTSLIAGDPVIADTVITQPLAGEASGLVTVLWRTVSSDGHPISGEYTFTVLAAPSPTPTETATSAPTVEPTPEATETSTPLVTDAPAEDAGAPWPWIVLGVVGAAVLAAIIYLLVSRARRRRALQRPTARGTDAGTDAGSER